MKVEYDANRDLLYIWFNSVGAKSAQTITVAPGVYADFDVSGRLIGLEVLDAKEFLGEKVQFEVTLPPFDMTRALERSNL
jgi:uncharacterized protein YuzE